MAGFPMMLPRNVGAGCVASVSSASRLCIAVPRITGERSARFPTLDGSVLEGRLVVVDGDAWQPVGRVDARLHAVGIAEADRERFALRNRGVVVHVGHVVGVLVEDTPRRYPARIAE